MSDKERPYGGLLTDSQWLIAAGVCCTDWADLTRILRMIFNPKPPRRDGGVMRKPKICTGCGEEIERPRKQEAKSGMHMTCQITALEAELREAQARLAAWETGTKEYCAKCPELDEERNELAEAREEVARLRSILSGDIDCYNCAHEDSDECPECDDFYSNHTPTAGTEE